MSKLKFCIVVDTEADFYYKIPSPEMSGLYLLKWKINNLLGRIYKYPKNRKGLMNIVKLFKKYEFPAAFAIVGHLYLKSCKGWPHFSEKKPEAVWFTKSLGKNWYDFDPCSNYAKEPGFYLGDFIEKEMKTSYFTFGLHSFSHEAYLTENKEYVESSIDAGIKAAERLGIKIKIYDGPWHMINDSNKPEEFLKILKNKNFEIVFYAGTHNGLKANNKMAISSINKKQGINLIQISKEIDGTSKKEKFNEILKEIFEKRNEDKIYCLAMHDFTWSHKGIIELEKVIKKLKNMERKKMIEIINFNKLA